MFLLQGAQVTGRALFLVFSLWYLNRFVGLEGKGVWTGIYGLFAILSVFSNLGFEVWLSRAAAAGDLSRRTALALLWKVKGPLWLLSFAYLLYVAYRGLYPLAVVLPFGLALVFDGWGVSQQAVFEGRMDTKAMALMTFLKSGGFVIVAVLPTLFIDNVGIAYFGWMFALVLGVRIYWGRKAWQLLPEEQETTPSWDWKGFVFLGAYTLATVLYFRVDAQMLTAMIGAEVTGIYGNAYDLVEGCLFISGSAAAVLYPRLVLAEDQERGPLFDRLFNLMCFVAVAGVCGVWFFGPWLGKVLAGGAFSPSEPVLTVLALSLPFMFANGLLSRWLFSCHQERFALVTALGSALLNILGNALFIPNYGALGAAWMTVFTEGMLCLTWLLLGRRNPRLLLGFVPGFLLLFAMSSLRPYPRYFFVLSALLFGIGLPIYTRYYLKVEKAGP